MSTSYKYVPKAQDPDDPVSETHRPQASGKRFLAKIYKHPLLGHRIQQDFKQDSRRHIQDVKPAKYLNDINQYVSAYICICQRIYNINRFFII